VKYKFLNIAPREESNGKLSREAKESVIVVDEFEVFQETPTEELTEANCNSRPSCSKRLLVHVIWFSDKILRKIN